MVEMIKGSPEEVSIDSIQEHPSNPRKGNMEALNDSISEIGFYGRIIVQRSTGYILAGNHRYKALKASGQKIVPVEYIDVDERQARQIVLADNRISDMAEYDGEALSELLGLLVQDGENGLQGTGYNHAEYEAILEAMGGESFDGLMSVEESMATLPVDQGVTRKNTSGFQFLEHAFYYPHVSVLNANGDSWMARRELWAECEIEAAQNLLPKQKALLKRKRTDGIDPVFAELLVSRYMPVGSRVLDLFGGDFVRGMVCGAMGRYYTGVAIKPGRSVEGMNEDALRLYEKNYSEYKFLELSMDLNPEWMDQASTPENRYDRAMELAPFFVSMASDSHEYNADEKKEIILKSCRREDKADKKFDAVFTGIYDSDSFLAPQSEIDGSVGLCESFVDLTRYVIQKIRLACSFLKDDGVLIFVLRGLESPFETHKLLEKVNGFVEQLDSHECSDHLIYSGRSQNKWIQNGSTSSERIETHALVYNPKKS